MALERILPPSSPATVTYRHAIDAFIEWYCSEPRLSFSKTVGIPDPLLSDLRQ